MSSLAAGALTQLRVIHAIALRETRTRFGSNQLGYLWALLEPVLWILTFYGLFRIVGRSAPDGTDIIYFLATGIVPYELVMKTSDRASLSIDANRALLFYPQVHTIDLILARGALEIATYFTVFVAIVGGQAAATGELEIEDVLQLVFGLGLSGLLGLTLGTVLCALSTLSRFVDRIKGPLFRPLFWVSGLFFTAEALPSRIREILMWNPILHCVEIVRDGFFVSYDSRHASAGYVLAWVIGLSFAGLTLERVVRRHIQPA